MVNIIFTFSAWDLLKHIGDSLYLEIVPIVTHMLLSCFDLVAVITNYPGILFFLISWLKEDYDLLHTWWM